MGLRWKFVYTVTPGISREILFASTLRGTTFFHGNNAIFKSTRRSSFSVIPFCAFCFFRAGKGVLVSRDRQASGVWDGAGRSTRERNENRTRIQEPRPCYDSRGDARETTSRARERNVPSVEGPLEHGLLSLPWRTRRAGARWGKKVDEGLNIYS